MGKRNYLRPAEISAVLADLRRRMLSKRQTRVQLVIFRLAVGVGLRRKEIAGLNIADVITCPPEPVVHVRAEITKGKNGRRKPRDIPLDLDAGTLADLADWKESRIADGAGPDDPFVCGLFSTAGKRLAENAIAFRWASAIQVLGPERVRQVSIHKGRHTFASLVLKAGYGLPALQAWLGHANIATTSIYTHMLDYQKRGELIGR